MSSDAPLRRLARYRLLFIIAGAVLLADQASKLWIAWRLPPDSYGPFRHIEVIPGFFNLVHVGNRGAAWSLFTGYSGFLAVLAVVTLAAIAWFRHHLALREPRVQLSFGLLCGGIVGNLIDRVAYGHVVDFLDFHFGSYIYPTFNLADSGIVCGVILYLWQSFRAAEKPAD